jgi:HrpA-like RNA helicase
MTVTQPRVIAAMTNAEQVSKNLMFSTGNPEYTLGH